MEKYQHYLHTFMEEFDFPQEAKTATESAIDRIIYNLLIFTKITTAQK